MSGKGMGMDSWSATLRLVAVMAAVAIFYLVGRWVAETLQAMVASGALPSV
jgi:hypothetical protein